VVLAPLNCEAKELTHFFTLFLPADVSASNGNLVYNAQYNGTMLSSVSTPTPLDYLNACKKLHGAMLMLFENRLSDPR
jgi:hypothetical protein